MGRSIQFLFGQYLPKCNHNIDKHFDDYYVLQFMDAGEIELAIGERVHRLQGQWFWSSYPGPRIRFRAVPAGSTWVHRYLAFNGAGVKAWIADGLLPIAPQHVSPAEEYAQRFDELLSLSRRNDRWGNARAALLMETLLTELAEQRAVPHTTPGWLEAGLARIGEMGAEVDYDKLALEVGMSSRTFRRKFTAAMGVSPREFAIASRIGHARQMLGGSELPIKTIASELGYRDVFFFSRQFTRFTGLSPAAYRRTKEA
jgi:AraC-like DNA-binding protein